MSQKSGPSRNQAGQELEEPEPPELEGWLSKLKHSQMVGLHALEIDGSSQSCTDHLRHNHMRVCCSPFSAHGTGGFSESIGGKEPSSRYHPNPVYQTCFAAHAPDVRLICRYYRSLQKLKGGTPSGTVSLYEINAVRDFDGSSFCVETTSRTFFLRADTPAEHSSWLSPLESYVSERKEWTARKIATQSGSYG